jgi:hypothetical protein
MKQSRWLGVLALALSLAAVPAGASTFLALTQEELVAQSDAVVQGRVIQVNSFWSRSGRLIMTEAMIQVEETILGDAPTVVVLKTAGGTVDGFTIEAHGFPKFEVNERFLLFVDGGEAARVVGYRQGQWRIVPDKAGVEIAVPMVEGDVMLLTPDGKAAVRPQPVRLETLKGQIRAAARAEEVRP